MSPGPEGATGRGASGSAGTVAQRRVLVTENWTDFLSLVDTQDDLGVIGVPSAWTTSQVDTKLTALLRKHTPTYFRGRVRTLGAEEEKQVA